MEDNLNYQAMLEQERLDREIEAEEAWLEYLYSGDYPLDIE